MAAVGSPLLPKAPEPYPCQLGQAFGVHRSIVAGGGIEGHADDVPGRAVCFEAIKQPFEVRGVIAVSEVDDDLAGREYGFGGVIAAVYQPGIVLHIDRRLAVGPEHAVVSFVADLHPGRRDPIRL